MVVRILGAWFSNSIRAEELWISTVDKVVQYLDRWRQSHPTIEGRCPIVQMVVGGIIQYLTQMQGMPGNIEHALVQVIKNFTWHEKRAPIAEHVLYSPRSEGDRDLLDIAIRNEAINMMQLKLYLCLGQDRLLWALVADVLLALNVPASE